ncbi:hypothetical protein G6F59_018735 [Rhizopus arrhizus]|nr:hypothetical protein G6F59_018735 [Rhizopus arrhizus]
MCQPGRPRPYGDSHLVSSGASALADFHSTKSSGSRLAEPTATRSPARRSSSVWPDNLPLPGKPRTA